MSVAGIIHFLERALEYRERYPGLSVECAVGLTGLDLGPAEQYAPLFVGCDLFTECPDGAEEVYAAVRGRYMRMQENLTIVRGFGLDPQDPEALTKDIRMLRSFVTD